MASINSPFNQIHTKQSISVFITTRGSSSSVHAAAYPKPLPPSLHNKFNCSHLQFNQAITSTIITNQSPTVGFSLPPRPSL
jgi:hypothetical protein